MAETFFPGNVRITGDLLLNGSLLPAIARDNLEEDALAPFAISFTELRVWDALQTLLPGTAAADDLALVGGTFGTAVPVVNAGDCKAATVTRRARLLLRLPVEYVAGQTVVLRIHAGMVTTVSDTSATVDVEAYLSDREGAVDGSDLCATGATSINSLTFADKDFTITAAGLSPGDLLDVRLTIACTDGATGTAVVPTIGDLRLLCDIKG